MWTVLALLACTPPAPTPTTPTPTGATGATGDTGTTPGVQRPLQFEGSGLATELGSSVLIVPSIPPLVAAGEPGYFYQEDEQTRAVQVVDPAVSSEYATIFLATSQDWYGDPYNGGWKTHFGENLFCCRQET